MVLRVRAGDRQAFEGLFRAYADRLCQYTASVVRSRAVAEELVQDVFADLWTRREQWDVRTTVARYLYAAVHHRAVNQLKRRALAERWATAATPAPGEDAPAMSTRSEPVDRHVEHAEFRAALCQALDRLPERCRVTFILRRQHHLSYTETAAVMGVTLKCVERQYTKALRLLREALAAHL